MTAHKHNLLGHDHLPHVRRRKKLLRYGLIGLVSFLTLTVVATLAVAIPSASAMRTLYDSAQAGKDDLFRAKAAAERLDLEAAADALSDARLRFATARGAYDRLSLVRSLPFFRKEVVAVGALIDAGQEISDALGEAVGVAEDLMATLSSSTDATGSLPDVSGDGRRLHELTDDERRELLRKLSEAPDRLGIAHAALERALSAIARIPRTPFTASLLDALAPQVTRLEALRDILAKDVSALAILPQVLGYPEPKQYLFLLLNNTEIRPGGGFIGTYGIIRMVDGGIERFHTDDIYAIDGPSEAYMRETPPAPLAKYLRSKVWFMRDANWSPDFVTSSQETERLYRLERGEEEFDGVIGVTPTVIERLLALTGPIAIDGVTFTSENIVDMLEYRVEIAFAKEGIPVARRKDIVGKLGEELVRRLFTLKLSELPKLAELVEGVLAERHLMAAFDAGPLMSAADARGWTGRFTVAEGDRLSVVDANLAALKSDPKVKRTVAYALRPDGDSWIARAAVTYKHEGRFDWKTTRYRTYTRFYAPLGSRFLKGEGMMLDDKLNDPKRTPGAFDVGEELGHAAFGAFISVEPGETRTLAVEYRVSDAVARSLRSDQYRLSVRKQLGTLAHGLTLDLDFGKNVTRAVPAEPRIEWGDRRYRLTTDLRTDREFTADLTR